MDRIAEAHRIAQPSQRLLELWQRPKQVPAGTHDGSRSTGRRAVRYCLSGIARNTGALEYRREFWRYILNSSTVPLPIVDIVVLLDFLHIIDGVSETILELAQIIIPDVL
jgi:hypothetical protein